MLKWLQRIFWRFSSPGLPLWTWGQPTQTSAWLWLAFSPSLTAPPPASSVPRLTVSTAFTPTWQNTYSPGENSHTPPSLHLPTKCKHFRFNVCYPLIHVSTHKLLKCAPTVFWQQMQRLSTSHLATCSLQKQLLHSQLELSHSSVSDICIPK